jgi:type ISP restriction-modification system protein
VTTSIEPEQLYAELKIFAQQLRQNFSSTISANPEDQLKRPVRTLIENFLPGDVDTRTETPVEGLGARPDIGVALQRLLCGHIELKAPGKGANTSRFRGADLTQWKKFKALPNLIYTDGSEWALYRDGDRIDSVIRFSGDVTAEGEAAVSDNDASRLHRLLADFFNWQPIVPDRPKALAKVLAPLCRLLRDDVEAAALLENSQIRYLYSDWQRLFFPEADTHRFADAYAQTLTYALLLARLSGAEGISPEEAAEILDSGHGLLAQTLRLLGQIGAREEMATAVDLLERVISAVDPERLSRNGDPWLYFYEDFLAEYDPKLRKDYGVYYTPVEVVGCQVRLCAQLLEERFGKPLNYADEGVTFLDPAAGTAAYPLMAMQYGLDKVASTYGGGMVAGKASDMARNFNAFEYMVGPYAVAHLRITKLLQDAGATFPDDGIRVFLTDTLENPEADPPRFAFAERQIAEEHERAQGVKRDTRILVCMGNPPYDREQRDQDDEDETRRKGGWVRFGEDFENRTQTIGILRDFIEGAPGVHVKNLYNDYVYFWRWALWKLYESEHATGGAILSFITASSYLRGPGFTVMRRHLRKVFDELWIIDLEGDNLGARKTENVFAIQTPVAIAIGVRYGEAQLGIPAVARYSKITGTREEKLTALREVTRFEDLEWEPCFSEWEKPLLPEGSGDYFSWPLITDLFPWQHTGSQFKRTWPISFAPDTLERRWSELLSSTNSERVGLFRETRDRRVSLSYSSHPPNIAGGGALQTLNSDTVCPPILRYSYRSFDRQWCIVDNRLGDYLKPDLWKTLSERQIFMTSLLTNVLGEGPAAAVAQYVPDLHCFSGRGGKDIIPLWRDVAATDANITDGLLSFLNDNWEGAITPEQFFAYSYALLACPLYTEKFSEELSIPGPRLPLTKDLGLFLRAVEVGKHLIWLHTYGERFVPDGESSGQIPQGNVRCTRGIPTSPENYPEDFENDEAEQMLRVGEGEFCPVAPEVWNFSVSGLQVVKSWLDYRKKAGAGRRSSPLDDIRPERWTTQMTTELLELLWVLEHTLAAYPELESIFEAIVSSECFTEDELPSPTEMQRRPPRPNAQMRLFS